MKKVLLLGVILSFFFVVKVKATSLPANFSSQIIANVSAPTAMEIAPDGRIFVLEKAGSIRVIKDGNLLSTPFANISGVSDEGERGLLGIAFDPDFGTNQYIYVYYITNTLFPTIRRLTASGDVAANSGTVIITFDQMNNASNHNGGGLHFAPDGKLMLAIGDNANGSNSQTLNNTRGKILRFNKDGTIPTDNPFYGSTTGNNRAIYALGFRNPFTFAVDPQDGKIYVNDVGQGLWEEISRLEAGGNYGWPSCEGEYNSGTSNPCSFPSVTPLYSYNHNTGSVTGDSIAGGTFYRDDLFPGSYQGKYFFGDYVDDWVKVYDPVGDTVSNFATGLAGVVDLKIAPDGALLIANINDGSIEKISYSPLSAPPLPVINTPTNGTTFAALDTINYTGSATDPEDGSLPASNFSWSIVLHHDTHTHPFLGPLVGATSGNFQIPNTGETSANIFYRISLTVRDSTDNQVTVTRDVNPKISNITLTSNIPALGLLLDHIPVETPHSFVGVENFQRTITARETQSYDGRTFRFNNWSDAGAAMHNIATPVSDTTYTADFSEIDIFSTWQTVPGDTLKISSDISMASVGDKLFQSVRGEDGAVWTRFYDNVEDSWTIWERSGGSTVKPTLASVGNKLFLSVRGYEGEIWTRIYDNSSETWGAWVKSGGATEEIGMASVGNLLFQATRGQDSAVWTRIYNNLSSTWGPWVIGGGTVGKISMSGVNARMVQSVRGIEGGAWFRIYDVGGSTWSPWTMSGGTSGYVNLATVGDKVFAAVKGYDGAMWTRTYDDNSETWNSWVRSGGTSLNPFQWSVGEKLFQGVKGSDGAAWTRSYNDGDEFWAAWTRNGGTVGEIGFGSVDNKLFEAVRGYDNMIYVRYYEDI